MQTTIFNGKVVDRAPVRGSSADVPVVGRTVIDGRHGPTGRTQASNDLPSVIPRLRQQRWLDLQPRTESEQVTLRTLKKWHFVCLRTNVECVS